jgi:hypothetical protein
VAVDQPAGRVEQLAHQAVGSLLEGVAHPPEHRVGQALADHRAGPLLLGRVLAERDVPLARGAEGGFGGAKRPPVPHHLLDLGVPAGGPDVVLREVDDRGRLPDEAVVVLRILDDVWSTTWKSDI